MRSIRGAGFWLVTWLLAFAFWTVHADSAKVPELLAGVAIAAIAATGTELARRQRVARIAVRAAFVRNAWRVAVRAVPDIARLTLAALKQSVRPEPIRGRVIAVRFEHGGDEDPRSNGRRALA